MKKLIIFFLLFSQVVAANEGMPMSPFIYLGSSGHSSNNSSNNPVLLFSEVQHLSNLTNLFQMPYTHSASKIAGNISLASNGRHVCAAFKIQATEEDSSLGNNKLRVLCAEHGYLNLTVNSMGNAYNLSNEINSALNIEEVSSFELAYGGERWCLAAANRKGNQVRMNCTKKGSLPNQVANFDGAAIQIDSAVGVAQINLAHSALNQWCYMRAINPIQAKEEMTVPTGNLPTDPQSAAEFLSNFFANFNNGGSSNNIGGATFSDPGSGFNFSSPNGSDFTFNGNNTSNPIPNLQLKISGKCTGTGITNPKVALAEEPLQTLEQAGFVPAHTFLLGTATINNLYFSNNNKQTHYKSFDLVSDGLRWCVLSHQNQYPQDQLKLKVGCTKRFMTPFDPESNSSLGANDWVVRTPASSYEMGDSLALYWDGTRHAAFLNSKSLSNNSSVKKLYVDGRRSPIPTYFNTANNSSPADLLSIQAVSGLIPPASLRARSVSIAGVKSCFYPGEISPAANQCCSGYLESSTNRCLLGNPNPVENPQWHHLASFNGRFELAASEVTNSVKDQARVNSLIHERLFAPTKIKQKYPFLLEEIPATPSESSYAISEHEPYLFLRTGIEALHQYYFLRKNKYGELTSTLIENIGKLETGSNLYKAEFGTDSAAETLAGKKKFDEMQVVPIPGQEQQTDDNYQTYFNQFAADFESFHSLVPGSELSDIQMTAFAVQYAMIQEQLRYYIGIKDVNEKLNPLKTYLRDKILAEEWICSHANLQMCPKHIWRISDNNHPHRIWTGLDFEIYSNSDSPLSRLDISRINTVKAQSFDNGWDNLKSALNGIPSNDEAQLQDSLGKIKVGQFKQALNTSDSPKDFIAGRMAWYFNTDPWPIEAGELDSGKSYNTWPQIWIAEATVKAHSAEHADFTSKIETLLQRAQNLVDHALLISQGNSGGNAIASGVYGFSDEAVNLVNYQINQQSDLTERNQVALPGLQVNLNFQSQNESQFGDLRLGGQQKNNQALTAGNLAAQGSANNSAIRGAGILANSTISNSSDALSNNPKPKDSLLGTGYNSASMANNGQQAQAMGRAPASISSQMNQQNTESSAQGEGSVANGESAAKQSQNSLVRSSQQSFHDSEEDYLGARNHRGFSSEDLKSSGDSIKNGRALSSQDKKHIVNNIKKKDVQRSDADSLWVKITKTYQDIAYPQLLIDQRKQIHSFD